MPGIGIGLSPMIQSGAVLNLDQRIKTLLNDGQPTVWLNPKDATTLTIATGVSEFRDALGSAFKVAQSTGTKQPTLTEEGLLLFDGSDDELLSASLAFAQPAYVYFVFKLKSWVLNKMLWSGRNTYRPFVMCNGSSPYLISNGGNYGIAKSATLNKLFIGKAFLTDIQANGSLIMILIYFKI